jgi:hypothetical protein
MKCASGSAPSVLCFAINMLSLLQILRSRWFTWCIHGGLWLLLYFAVSHLGGRTPQFREGSGAAIPQQATVPVAKLEPLFAPGYVRKTIYNPTNAANPFFTKYFVPATPAPPPPPTTRKIEVTYQGYYQTADGPKYAVLTVAGGLMVAPVGGLVATNVYVADANMQAVILTNTTAQTNTLTLNAKKEIEVPIK